MWAFWISLHLKLATQNLPGGKFQGQSIQNQIPKGLGRSQPPASNICEQHGHNNPQPDRDYQLFRNTFAHMHQISSKPNTCDQACCLVRHLRTVNCVKKIQRWFKSLHARADVNPQQHCSMERSTSVDMTFAESPSLLGSKTKIVIRNLAIRFTATISTWSVSPLSSFTLQGFLWLQNRGNVVKRSGWRLTLTQSITAEVHCAVVTGFAYDFIPSFQTSTNVHKAAHKGPAKPFNS